MLPISNTGLAVSSAYSVEKSLVNSVVKSSAFSVKVLLVARDLSKDLSVVSSLFSILSAIFAVLFTILLISVVVFNLSEGYDTEEIWSGEESVSPGTVVSSNELVDVLG